jgi:hypothetical protein
MCDKKIPLLQYLRRAQANNRYFIEKFSPSSLYAEILQELNPH